MLLLIVPLGLDQRQANFMASTAWAASADSGKERATDRWQDVLGKAKKEGKVVLLGPPSQKFGHRLFKPFKKSFRRSPWTINRAAWDP